MHVFTNGVDSWIIIFSMFFNSLLYLIILVFNYFHIGLWEPLQAGSLWYVPIIWGISLFSGIKCFRLTLYTSPEINHFSKKPRFLLSENGFLGTDICYVLAHCYWGVCFLALSAQRARNIHIENTHTHSTYTYTCTHTHTYIYTWAHICLFSYNTCIF